MPRIFILISCYQAAQSRGLSGWNLVRKCGQSEASVTDHWPVRGPLRCGRNAVSWCPQLLPQYRGMLNQRAASLSPWGLTGTWHIHDTNISIRKHQLQIKKHHHSLSGINSAWAQTTDGMIFSLKAVCGRVLSSPAAVSSPETKEGHFEPPLLPSALSGLTKKLKMFFLFLNLRMT